MTSIQRVYFDPNMIMYEMLNIKVLIQQNFNYITAQINKIEQNNNKVIEANKKEETVREKLKKYTKKCKYVDQCKYMSSKTCWFLHEQIRIDSSINHLNGGQELMILNENGTFNNSERY